ncbi:MAG: transporter substrate-binding domain-containing protein [Eubacteriales bacterium]
MIIKRLAAALASLMLAMSTFTAPITARSPQTSEEQTKTIRVGCVDIDNFLQVSGETAIGYGADYLQEISVYTDWNYEYVTGTWSQCLKWLKDGDIDLLMPAEYSDQRAQDYIFSSQECCIDYVMLLAAQNNNHIYYEDFGNYNLITVGMIKDNYLNECFAEYAEENGFTYQSVYYKTGEEQMAALKAHEIDAIITGNLNIPDNCKILAKFDYMSAYFMMNSESKALMDELNDALYRINLENPYFTAQIYNKYYAAYGEQAKVFTREEAHYIDGLDSLRIVCDSQNAPFEWYDEKSDNYLGIDVDILKEISENSGIRFVFVQTDTLEQSWELIRDGGADIICGVYIDKSLSKEYSVNSTASYISESSDAVCRSGEKLVLSDVHTVAVSSSMIGTGEYIKTHYPAWETIEYKDRDACLDAVERGDADLTFVSTLAIQSLSVLGERQSLSVMPGLTISVPLTLGVSSAASPLLIPILNKAIRGVSPSDINQFVTNNTSSFMQRFSVSAFIGEYPAQFAVIVITPVTALFLCAFFIYRTKSQTRYAQSLKEKNEELRRANRANSAFFSQLSHDLRTPMNAVLGYSELGLESANPDDTNGYLRKIYDSGQYLLRLINDSLEISRMDTGKLILRREPCTVGELSAALKNILQIKADEKHIELTIDGKALDGKAIFIDKMRVQQILVNLLNNAIKFTPDSGHVSLCISRAPESGISDAICFLVTDDGGGMSREFIENRLYHPFEQEHRPETSDEIGTGLGLSIVKGLTELMGGVIACESELGVGTRFTVTLPAEISAARQAAPEKTTDYSSLNGKRVLVCEDHPLNAEIAVKQLNKHGIITDCARDGREGVDRFSASVSGYYDAVLMDIRMPVMNGLEATSAIRALDRPDAKIVPIIAMTANAYPEDIAKCIESGMNAHLTKPIEPRILCGTLLRYIR